MEVLTSTNQQLTANEVYDTCSASLYGMILKASATGEEAEDTLVSTFKTFFQQRAMQPNTQNSFISLLKISINIMAQKSNLSKQAIAQVMLKGLCRAGVSCSFIAALAV